MGRFINADDISILNQSQEELNGLNLYVYCFNNPVNDVDENGNWSWKNFWKGVAAVVGVVVAVVVITGIAIATAGAGAPLLGAAIMAVGMSTAVGAVSGGISAIHNGESFYGGVLGGAIKGFGIGAAIGLGMVTGGTSLSLVIPGIIGAAALNYLTGNLAYAIETKANNREFVWKEAMINGGLQAVTSVFAFATGFILGNSGAYNLPGKGILSVLKNEGLKQLFVSDAFRNFIGSQILKLATYYPITTLLKRWRKN